LYGRVSAPQQQLAPVRVIRSPQLHQLIDAAKQLGRHIVAAAIDAQGAVEQVVYVPPFSRPAYGLNPSAHQQPDAVSAMGV